jgi:signal peptidase I
MHLSEDLKEWIKDISISLVCAAVILTFIKPTIVKEHSMENTLHENDYLFISRQAYNIFGDVKRGDIIIFPSSLKTGGGKSKTLIKRVIAIPGDTIAIKDRQVILNGEPLDEPYTKDGYTKTDLDEITIPQGKIFVMGDNRQNSSDSRSSTVGLVDIDSVMGKAVFRLYPFSEIGGLY